MISYAVYCHSLVSFGLSKPGAAGYWCQKAAYLDGWVHFHLLITGGFSSVFITCADRSCVHVFVQGLLLHRLNCRRSAGVYREVPVSVLQLAIFMSSMGISVLSSAQPSSASQITSFTSLFTVLVCMWLTDIVCITYWILYVWFIWNSNQETDNLSIWISFLMGFWCGIWADIPWLQLSINKLWNYSLSIYVL